MIRVSALAVSALLCLAAPPAFSEGRTLLGSGRLTTNDVFGDFKDAWQSGSVSSSRIYGTGWHGALPSRPFDLLEFRIGGQLITPGNIVTPLPGDRPFAGSLSLGVHTHYAQRQIEIALGADLVVTGPQTGLDDLQTAIHDGLGILPASQTVLSNQIENGVHPTLVTEAGRSFALGGQAVLRPFAEARWGVESLARVGFDLSLGGVGQGELLVRDPVSGHRYRTVTGAGTGFSYILGADVAQVDSSVYLPESRGYVLTDTRSRVRAGVHWQGKDNAVFYGLTWLSEEFEAQADSQLVGSVRLNLQF
jgi:hypothetical protein